MSQMTALFGWNHGVPNMADTGAHRARRSPRRCSSPWGLWPRSEHVGQTAGFLLEQAVETALAGTVPTAAPSVMRVERGRQISDFRQYSHLATLNEVIRKHPDPLVRVTFGGDYLIKPDVVVEQLSDAGTQPSYLHAAVPCKWTLRSDRAQNVRHKAVTMIGTGADGSHHHAGHGRAPAVANRIAGQRHRRGGRRLPRGAGRAAAGLRRGRKREANGDTPRTDRRWALTRLQPCFPAISRSRPQAQAVGSTS